MKHKLLFLLFFALTCSVAYADDECDQSIVEAKKMYNAGKYAEAKKYFQYVQQICGDKYGDANVWVKKCDNAINSKPDKTQSTTNKTSSQQTKSQSSTPTLTVSQTSISATATGTTETTITVSSNRSWEVQYPSGTMYNVTRNGNKLTVTIYENNTTESRSAYFNVRTTDGSNLVQKVSLSQSAKSVSYSSSSEPTLSVSNTSIWSTSYGTTEYLTVTSDREWEIEYASGDIYSVTRSGNTLIVVIKENPTSTEKTDFFNVKTKDGKKKVRVSITLNKRSTSSSSSSSSSSYNSYSSRGYTGYDDFCLMHGDFEMTWFGMGFFFGTGIGLEFNTLALRWGWFGFDPLIMGWKYDVFDGNVFFYQPDVRFYIPWDDDWAFMMAVGPSLEVGDYSAFWFKAEVGIQWHYGEVTSSNIFLRYDGSIMLGMTLQFGTGW